MIPLRSLALLERGASPHRGIDATPRAFDRLDWYQKTYFHDDPDRLGIWLREQGFSDRETAARYIEIDASVAESNATWAKCISEAMAALEAQSSEARLAAAGKLGLSAISYPFLLWAKYACQAALDYVVAAGLVEDLASIRQNFMDYLLKRLELASLPTAGLLVNIERLQGRLVGESPESRGAYFAQQMVNPIERKTLLSSFPVVDRVQAEITVNAIAYFTDLLTHASADQSAIEQRFGFKSFVISKIELGCGDPHNGGRSVAILHIGADKLVYKPQSLAIDQAFYRLVAWIATRIDKAPATVPILSRPDRGWVAFINYRDCETSEDVDDCYRRLGSLVCLLHLCGASDIHFENVICNGNQPVIVDLETTMTGLPKTVMAENFVMRSGAALYDTVLWIGYLPCPTYIGGGRIDLSAAGAVESQLSPLKALALRRNDRDDVGLESEPSQIEAQGSVPRLGGVAAPLHLHLDAFLSGFDDTYRALETAREELLAPAGVLAAFKPLSFRWVARNTATYATLLRSSYHPTMLRDGVDHEMAFASLRLGNFKPARLKQIAAAEIRDLWRSDIPYFTARATSRSVWTSSGERIDDLFRASPFDEMISRLQGFGEIERSRQVAFIRTSVLAARLEGGPEQPNDPIAPGTGPSSEADINWLGLAVEIGDTLAKQAIFVDGAPFWVAPTSFGTDYYTASIVNETLYDGVAGLAVFFGELAARTGERRFANLAACARLGFKSADAGGKSAHNIGAFDGAAGLVFAELRLGAASGDYDERYIRRQLAKLVERARGDEAVDVVNGVAGVGVVALRALSALGRNHVAEDLIQVCGDRLIELAQPGDAGASWTAGAIGKNLTGFSHGAAGVAWALAQLGEHTGDARYFDYCNAALTFEASTFDADARNWRDLRGGLVHATTWCHGAPGTTLARQAIRGFGAGKLDQGALEDEIATGLAAVRRLGAGGSHCLCHGAFGNLAPLIRDGHIEDANDLARRAVEEYRGEGRWRCGVASYAPTPGLMSGLAGIGMGLLSMAAPSTPDILTLEL